MKDNGQKRLSAPDNNTELKLWLSPDVCPPHYCSGSGWLESQMGNNKEGTTMAYVYIHMYISISIYMDMTKSQGVENGKSIQLR